MKKAVFAITLTGLLISSSCTKTTPTSDGTWTFESVTYPATSYAYTLNAVYVNNQTTTNTSNYGTLAITFYHVLPTSGGSYVVTGAAYPDTATQVSILLTTAGTTATTYNASGGNGQQSINVSVSSTGQLSLSGSGIEMYNHANRADSSTLSFSISQPY